MNPSQVAAAQFQPQSRPISAVSAAYVHPTPAANSTPSLSQPVQSHPSYTEMIKAAAIERVYPNLPPTHSALLTHHLQRLKNSGQLVMLKNSYHLPSFRSAPSAPDHSSTPKRRPGRPPKLKQPESEPVSVPTQLQQFSASVLVPDMVSNTVNGAVSAKRPRGRPPKKVVAPFAPPTSDVGLEEVFANPESTDVLVKRRGRPPKKQKQQETHEGDMVVSENGVEVVERRSGRERLPKKIHNVLAPVSGTVGKKRGWPRGRPRGKRGVAGLAVGKKRGRPRGKGSLPVVAKVAKRVFTGKHRGRPKKNSVLVKHTSEQGQEMANEELLRKLEDMQSKLRDAVGVIRPHLANQSAPDALIALQQLEELSTMNVTAFPALTLPPPVMTVPTLPPPVFTVPTLPPSTSALESLAAPSLADPTMIAFAASSGLSVPLPFSMDVPSMAPLHASSSLVNQLPDELGPTW